MPTKIRIVFHSRGGSPPARPYQIHAGTYVNGFSSGLYSRGTIRKAAINTNSVFNAAYLVDDINKNVQLLADEYDEIANVTFKP